MPATRLNGRRASLGALRFRREDPPDVEPAAALVEIEKIAWLRLKDLLEE